MFQHLKQKQSRCYSKLDTLRETILNKFKHKKNKILKLCVGNVPEFKTANQKTTTLNKEVSTWEKWYTMETIFDTNIDSMNQSNIEELLESIIDVYTAISGLTVIINDNSDICFQINYKTNESVCFTVTQTQSKKYEICDVSPNGDNYEEYINTFNNDNNFIEFIYNVLTKG